jgi:hypothetical protein
MFYFYVDLLYNMKVFGYSISLNVLILIGILYLIMVVNALSGSCNREGLIGIKNKINKKINKITQQVVQPVVQPAVSTYNDPGPTLFRPPNVNRYQEEVNRAAAAQEEANRAARQRDA